MATYLLLDGHSLAYRAWFALQETGMKTSSGQETQAVYGFVSMLTKLLDDFEPDGIAVAFDRSEPTFHDEIAPDYKAGRAVMPDPLKVQLGLIGEFVDTLGVPRLELVGFEADDIIGTVATRLKESGNDVIIVTGDRDTYQLVSDPHVKVLYNRRGVSDYVLYDEAGIVERTGVRPIEYPLLAALRGDTSDNLPGVPGVGDKTAAKLVNDFHDVDGIYANLAKLTPKLRASLAENEAQVRRNLSLTPIVCDVPIELDQTQLSFARVDNDVLERLLVFLEMRTLKERLSGVLARLLSGTPGAKTSLEVRERPSVVIDDVTAFDAWATRAPIGAKTTIEVVYAGAPGRSALESLAVAVAGLEEIAVLSAGALGDDATRSAFAEFLMPNSAPVRPLIAHRAKELMRTLLPNGIDLVGLELDSAVVAYLIDPSEGQDSLEEIARRRGIVLDEKSAAAQSGQLGFALDEDTSPVAQQSARRAAALETVSESLARELEDLGGATLWDEIERPLVRVLAKMEVAGIAVDVKRLEEIAADLTEEARTLEKLVYEQAGEVFNINSPPQLRVVLYEKLGFKPQKKTKTGYSTDAQTLEKLRDEHPMIETMLRYREVEKLRSTYGTGLLAEVAPDGRIHASFNQTVARTGRLSSDAPNLHNIPVRTDGGRLFREAFIPAPGSQLLVADYNQIELRVIAHLSDDPGLVAAFDEGKDIHAATASGIYGVDIDKVTPMMRAKSKMVSYGLAYGMEAYGLSQRLQIAVDEAATILEQYFEAFPFVKAYMEGTVAEAKRRGYTETERGRRRYLPELAASNFRVRQAAERQAMNAGIQGLAADIFKIALVRLDASLEERGLSSRLVLQVHDEVILEVLERELDEVRELTSVTMREAYPLKVPLDVHLSVGPSWAEAKD